MLRANQIATTIADNVSRLWPLPLVLQLQAVLLGWQLIVHDTMTVTRLSLVTALLMAACGLVPALLRPSRQSALAGSVAVLLAVMALFPSDPLLRDLPHVWPLISNLTPELLIRLINSAFLTPILLHFSLQFPTVRPNAQALVITSYGLSAVLLMGALFSTPPLADGMLGGLLLISAVQLLVTVIRLVLAGQRHPAAVWVLVGILVASLPTLVRPLGLTLRNPFLPYGGIFAAQLALPIALSYAMLRYDLFGMDSPRRRAFAYTLVSLALLTGYFGLTALLTGVLLWRTTHFRGLAALTMLLVSAVAFVLLRDRAQQTLDRSFYPDRLQFAPAIAAAQSRLAGVLTREQTLTLLTNELPEQLQARWAMFQSVEHADLPTQPDQTLAWHARLAVGDLTFGHLWIGPRRSGLRYDETERAQLDAIARQAALALAYAHSLDALREINQDLEGQVSARSNQLIVQQREIAVLAERQRLARELHDSISQSLFSLSLGARAIRRLVRNDPDAAVAALEEQESAAQHALADMRALLMQLRQPTTAPANGTTTDLCAALREQIDTLSRRGELTASLEAPSLLLLPSARAEQILQIASEALHNVVKHSGVPQAQIQLQNGAQITLRISDQGRGFAPEPSRTGHYGLRGMQERAAALGGTLTIDSTPGDGTTVQLVVAAGG